MGKRGKKFGKKKGGGGGGGQRRSYEPIQKTNEKFERYYNELGIIPEEEREAFWEALRRDLPNSFRFTGSRGHALALQQRLKEYYIPRITSITYEGNYVDPPQPVPWYPDQLAWWMTTPKNVIRRFPPFASFQKFLVAEAHVGNITRQEVVSMIPPLLLDVRPGMVVLDMCAAPGSKAAQLMEMIHAGEEDNIRVAAQRIQQGNQAGPLPEGLEDDGRTTGLLIANDSDYKRAHMLIHQMKRLNSPNLIVTNHDATMYPSIKLPPPPAPDGKPPKNVYLKFDRILADVPCSGDGTARKNINVWPDWVPGNAMGLHVTQVRILVRALQMLKVGGRVVYSTCSMNPVEDEAVVASAISRCGGAASVEIVDCSNELPALKRAPGLRTWKVMDREGRMWGSWQEVDAHRAEHGIDGLGRLSPTMFPPEVSLPLERCIRVYPHLQDTGGFFIAVLEKKSEIRAKPEDTSKTIPKASVAAVAEELDRKNRNGAAEPLEKINALDEMVEPKNDGDGKNATVAEASHQPSYTTSLGGPASPEKRSGDSLEDQMPSKRTKVQGDTEAIVGDRPVHLPSATATQGGDKSTEASKAEQTPEPSRQEPASQKKKGQQFEEPFKYLDPNLDEINEIYRFYNISNRFPRDRYMVRNAQGSPTRTIYYTSTLARDILTENEGRGIKFVHCGVKMFVKQEVPRPDVCRWRIQTDGLQIIEPWLGPERSTTLRQKEPLRRLLIEMFPRVDGNAWRDLGEIGEWARDISLGCAVLRIELNDSPNGISERMVLPTWRSLRSLNLMLPKEDRRALLLRLFNDETPLVNTTQKKQQAADDDSDVSSPVETRPEASDEETSPAEKDQDIKNEEEIMKEENLELGQKEAGVRTSRETFQHDRDEEDKFNATV